MDFDGVKLLHRCDKGFKLDLLESFEIDKHSKNNYIDILNEQVEIFYTPLYKYMPKKCFNSKFFNF